MPNGGIRRDKGQKTSKAFSRYYTQTVLSDISRQKPSLVYANALPSLYKKTYLNALMFLGAV